MKRFAFFGLISALLLGALLFANRKRQQTPIYLLHQYPPSANLTYVIEHHLQHSNSVIFRSDEFDPITTVAAIGCEIDQNGSEICQSYSGNMAQNAGISALAPAQLVRFQTLLRALPPGVATAPPLHRLLLVSFRDGPNWTTRLYDRAHLPPQISQIAKLGGFRGLKLRPADK